MQEHKALVRAEDRLPLSRAEDIETLRNTIAKGASDSEMALFVEVCQRLRLDPFAKQIYLVKRNGQPATIQASIDGLRVVAERSGEYEGQSPPQWCGRDGIWRDVWLANEPPAAAKVGVFRRGFREPMIRVAKLEAYKQPGPFWARMPEHMLAKVAEALALRAAFPNDLSGIYAPEEMGEHAAIEARGDERSHWHERKVAATTQSALVIDAEPESDNESPKAAQVLRQVRTVFADAQIAMQPASIMLDAAKELEAAGLTNKTRRGGIVETLAKLGVPQHEIAEYLGRPCAEMVKEDLEHLMEVVQLLRGGHDSWAALLAAKTKSQIKRQ